MIRRVAAVLAVLLLLGLVFLWFSGGAFLYRVYAQTTLAAAPADLALQDDARVELPRSQPHVPQPYDPEKNLYWGDLHVHTEASFDARLFGTRLTVEDAYRFARGETLRNVGGERMQLSRPLDFVAITDHAEGFGLRSRCSDDGLGLVERVNCSLFQDANSALLVLMLELGRGAEGGIRGGEAPAGVYQPVTREATGNTFPICVFGEGGVERCYRDSNQAWARYVALADQYNEPGRLTTFPAYEFSPVLPNAGKHHRNVIFNDSRSLPEHAISSLDVANALELWRGLEESCEAPCDFLTIPHNMNLGWGLFYSRYTWDGKRYGAEDWRLRRRREPLAEVYQVKGASECALGVGATDEECRFSQVLEPCAPGQTTGCAFQTGFARQGLAVGLELDRELGFNPLAFGMIGATDNHNANPGDAEEWDFVGKVGLVSSPAIRRRRDLRPGAEPFETILQFHESGGVTGVWAEENTRQAIFAALQRREAYATSGPRIALRLFAGWGFDLTIADAPAPVAQALAGGVPMGGVLRPSAGQGESPTFFVWALADSMSAPLQRVQVIKGWIDDAGETHERVWDVVCAGGASVDPLTGRCPDGDASVDLSDCSLEGESGTQELIAAFQDPSFDASQAAFYYVRALQNPTCRWSTYDAIRLGMEPDPRVPATIRERAWSSPIWIDP